MPQATDSRGRDALLRLLADASSSAEARVDALIALSQRTVWVATWEPASASFRKLEQEDGRTALPVFTDEWELDHAAAELEWNQHGVVVGRREIGAREALRKVVDEKLDCLIVDLASRHCLEANRAEIEPLAAGGARSESQGAFAAVGRITNTMLEAVRSNSTFPTPGTKPPSHPPATSALPAPSAVPPRPTSQLPPRPSQLPSPIPSVPLPDGSAKLMPVHDEPPDAMLDALTAIMRGYPEVEWAAFCLVSMADSPPVPMIAVRVDSAYRQRAHDIASAVSGTTALHGQQLDTMLLDRPDLLKLARLEGITFFPWKRRKTGGSLPSVP